MFQQQPMDEAITSPDFLENDTVNRVIEELSVMRMSMALNDKNETQGIVLNNIKAAIP